MNAGSFFWEDLREFAVRHGRWLSVGSFLSGFALRVLTIGRIDSAWNIVQQGMVIALLGFVLGLELLHSEGLVDEPESPRLRLLWQFRLLIAQFFFGSLMSAYAIFYFKSASWLGLMVFLPLLAALMVLVETRRFRSGAAWLRVGVYAVCLGSYFGYLVPILVGHIGKTPFLIAMAAAASVLALLFVWVRSAGLSGRNSLRGVLAPGMATLGVLTALYFLQLIPPVPLSLQHVGIYHGVEKVGASYRLLHERRWWKIWEFADQKFRARPGDQIYLFARIFAPRSFQDEIRVRWLRRHPRYGWVTWDVIPMTILGGREEGFRGYAYKANYEPGLWRVQIETVDGREVGRIQFRVVPDHGTAERRFAAERM